MDQVTETSLKPRIVKAILQFLFIMAILEQLDTIHKVLNLMRISGEPLPLQGLMNQLDWLWTIVNRFWTSILGNWLANLVFYEIGIGGVVIATFLWYIWTLLDLKGDNPVLPHSPGHKLLLIFALLMLLSIILGMNSDVWVPYKQDPNFTINLKHKHQLSAGIYFSMYFQLWHRAKSRKFSFFNQSRHLSQHPILITFMFLVNMLDNLAAFDWFPLNLGFQDVYLDGPSIVSFDKVYHALGSSFFTILTIFLLSNIIKGTLFSVFGNILWEIFEISIQPAEFGDSGLDLLFDVLATLLTAVVISRNFTPKAPNIEIKLSNPAKIDEK